jgi:hypothetical protein
MTTRSWIGPTEGASGSWTNASAWSAGVVPASGGTVLLTQDPGIARDPGQTCTATLNVNEGPYAALTVSSANATLALTVPGLTLTVPEPVTVSGGTLAATGSALAADSLAVSGGSLQPESEQR